MSRYFYSAYRSRAFFILCILLLGSVWAEAQETAPPQPQPPAVPSLPAETYRLRVENSLYGRIEASADGGIHYVLIGRVLRPAETALPDRTATLPGTVIRSAGDGLAFAVAPGMILKLLPGQPSPAASSPKPASAGSAKSKIANQKSKIQKPEPAAIQTDLEPKRDLFGDLLPPRGAVVRFQVRTRKPSPFPDGYSPGQEDVYLFSVNLPLPAVKSGANSPSEEQRQKERQAEIGKRLEAMAQTYREGAMDRAVAEKRPVVSGILTLRAKVPAGEPEPITAVTYAVDGDVVAAQNVMPFAYGFDTKRVPNGEHVLEIRALSQYATTISRVRALVYIQNTPPPDKPSPTEKSGTHNP